MRNYSALFASVLAISLGHTGYAQEGGRIVETPLELTIMSNTSRYAFDEDWPVEQKARELTGIHLVNLEDPELQKKSLEQHLADETLPDIVGAQNLKAFVNEYGPVGAFQGLSDLIDEHAPNIKRVLSDRPELRAAISAADGEIYYIPYLPDGKYGRGYFIRQDWLRNLGLEVPQTVQELETVLEAFRNQDPNGNGVQDEIPFFVRHWQEVMRLVTLWDGRSSGSDNRHDFYVEDGILKHPYFGEAYKTGVMNLADWYERGLIDQEVFTRKGRPREELLSENLGGMTHDWFPSTALFNRTLQDKIKGFEFQAIVPPETVSGKRVAEHRRTIVKPDGWAIGFNNKNPVETIKYFDFWFSEEGRRLSNFGIEGVQYTMVDGEPVFTDQFLSSEQAVNSQLWDIGAQIPVRGYYQDYEYEIQWSEASALSGMELYDQGDYLIDEFLGIALNEIEQSIFDRYWDRILDFMLDRQKAWITNERDIEEDWDDYVKTLDMLGFTKVMDMMNAAYRRQYG